MKKLIILLILFIPFIVLAEDCDISKITISSIEQVDINGNTEVIDEPSYQGRNINLNLKMYEVGDSITYDLVLNNASNEDYMIDEDTFKSDSNYIEYVLSINDNSNVVKANSSKNMTLTVSYKNEVDNSLLTNNKYNASNKLNFNMNTAEKPNEIEEISTNPVAPDPIVTHKIINKEVENPITSSIGFKLIIVILLITIVIILLTVINKKQFTKYIVLIGVFSIVPTIYAVCTCDIEVETTIEIEKIPRLFDTVVGLANEQDACVEKYNGKVTDQVGQTVTTSNVYFDKCVNKRNVIFNNMCWQVIRTTETGGTKLVYNGDVVDGKCESTRGNHKGIVQSDYSIIRSVDEAYLYGDSFTYDIVTKKFTLTDTETATWSDSTYENILGKYTCKSLSDTCSTIYQINGYYSNTDAFLSPYKINDTNYAQIGTSAFNANPYSPAMVGYMFNKVYNYNNKSPGTNTYKYGNTFTYDSNTGNYTLSGTTQTISDWSTGYNTIKNTHYTCWNDTGICPTISYINSTSPSNAYYLNMSGGKDISDILEEMLSSNNVNRYNSSIKGIIDAWYRENLLSKTNMLEDTVYCNARNIIDYGGFNLNGGTTTSSTSYLQFKNAILNNNITCTNITDQFAVGNSKAQLIYPVGLTTTEELYILTNNNSYEYYDVLTKTGYSYWVISPYLLYLNDATVRDIDSSGYNDYYYIVDIGSGVRPVVSLKNNTTVVGGIGSEDDPWIVE